MFTQTFALALLGSCALAITGVDVSQPLSQSTWECLMSPGGQGPVEWASVRAYCSYGDVDSNAVSSIKAAKAAGISDVSAYIFPCVSCGDAAGQVQDTVNNLKNNGATPDMYWYDVERYNWSTSLTSNQQFITDMIVQGKKMGIKAGIYTNYYNWQDIVGLDWTYPADQGLPLWYAHYDNSQTFSDYDVFGGWSKPAVKQYEGDKSSCGVGIDYDWMTSLTSATIQAPTPQPEEDSSYCHADMNNLEYQAKVNSEGKYPDGRCYSHVSDYIDAVGYGGILKGGFDDAIPPAYWAEAHDFADYLNQGDNAAQLDLKNIMGSCGNNPYNAPEGAIVVVAAGAPGTSNPTAGDIAVKGSGDDFYNGGMMGYGGKSGFPTSYTLGIYVPTKCTADENISFPEFEVTQ